MIRMEAESGFEVSRRRKWVVLTVGTDRFLLDPTEAVELSNLLVDATEQEVAG